MARRPLKLASAALVLLVPGAGTAVAADDLLYRCYPNLCKVRPDGSDKRQLTRDGRRQGPVYAWVSASRDGKRLGMSFGNDAYVANAKARRLGAGYRDTGGAVPVVQISPDGRTLATIEPTLELQPPPPGVIGPPLLSQNPFLFTHGVASRAKETVARSIVSAGWLGGRLMRSDTADVPPFTQRICLLRTNSSFECDRLAAEDPGREVWDPAASPNGRYVAAASAPGGRGPRADRPVQRRHRPAGPDPQQDGRLDAVLVERRKAGCVREQRLHLRRARVGRSSPAGREGRTAGLGSALGVRRDRLSPGPAT